MNAITKFDLTPRQIALVKTTVAKDTNDEEFNLYMEVAKAKGLDPFLGQIIPMVFNKGKSDKRKMTIIISRDGQRVIAQRCGDYRPASKPPVYEIDRDLIGPLNPQASSRRPHSCGSRIRNRANGTRSPDRLFGKSSRPSRTSGSAATTAAITRPESRYWTIPATGAVCLA